MQLMLRILAIVNATMAIPLAISAAASGRSAIEIFARFLIWIMMAIALWEIAVLRERIEDRAGG